ncbi:MAG: beta-ketoacyl synthase N-terminal-like domain-containing protein, partial [Myxococcota bacterium]
MSPALPIPIRAFSAVGGLGATTAELLANLDAGTSGLRPIEDPRVPFETVVGRIDRTRLAPVPTPFETYDCHHARLGLLALDEVREAADAAVARWGAHRVGVFLGTSTGGLEATERGYQGWHDAGALPADYGFHTQHDFNALATLMAGLIGAEGPALTISTACSSSGKVFGTAQRWIATGRLDAAIVGGVDSLCRMTVRGFRSLGVLDSDPCRPFSADRKGINIGEGAALFVLEREADDAALELLGVGESADA